MNKYVISFAVIAGLLGLALTTRTDIANSLLFGIALTFVSGVLSFFALKIQEKRVKSERATLLEAFSLNDIQTSLNSTTSNLCEMEKNLNLHQNQIFEQMNESCKANLQTNVLLEQIILTIQTEMKTLLQQQDNSSTIMRNAITNEFSHFATTQSRCADDLVKLNETISTYNHQRLEQITEIHNIATQADGHLEQIPIILQAETKMLIEQQQNLSVILLSDFREILNEFTDNQSRNADEAVDSIKRIMKTTTDTLKDLPLVLKKFSSENAEIIKKSVDGYKQFELLMNTTLEQMTSISNQDYDLLKGMMK